MPKRPTTTITRAIDDEFEAPPPKKQPSWNPDDTFQKDGTVRAEPGIQRGDDIQELRQEHTFKQAVERSKNWFRFKYGKKSNKRNLGEDLDQPKITSAFANIKKTKNIGTSQFEREPDEFNNDSGQVQQFYAPEQFYNEDTRDSLAEQEAGNMEAMDDGTGEGGPGVKSKRVGAGAGGAGGQAVGSINGELMPITRPIGQPGGSTWYTRTYTKTFLLAIENCNWVRANKDGYQEGPTQHIAQMPYYCFPMDRKFMYIDPVEWLNLHDNRSIVKCLGTKAQFRYKSYRPYFVTGGTDLQVASNTATPYLNVYCNMKHKMPYQMWRNDNPTTQTDPGTIVLWDPNSEDLASYTQSGWTQCEEILDRLYGDAFTGFGEAASEATGLYLGNTGSIGAIDGPRRWFFRPAVHCNIWAPPSANSRSPRSIGDFISGLHLEAYKELELPGTALGAGFEIDYQPANALWKAASSIKLDPAWASHLDQFAVGSNTSGSGVLNPGFVPYLDREERLIQMSVAGGILTLSDHGAQDAGATVYSGPQIMSNTDWDWLPSANTYELSAKMAASYFEAIDQSAMQDVFAKRDYMKPTPKDIWIGVTPQIQTDGTLLRGVTEIEIKTEMTVAIKVHDSHFAHRINLGRQVTGQPAGTSNTIRTFAHAKQLNTRIFDESHMHINTHQHDYHTGYTFLGKTPLSYLPVQIPSYASVDKIRDTPPKQMPIKPSGTALN